MLLESGVWHCRRLFLRRDERMNSRTDLSTFDFESDRAHLVIVRFRSRFTLKGQCRLRPSRPSEFRTIIRHPVTRSSIESYGEQEKLKETESFQAIAVTLA